MKRVLNAKPPSSFPRCRCKHSAPLFTVLGCLMQQKASPANILAGKHSHAVPPWGKNQEERFYPDLLPNSCSHFNHEAITSVISAANMLHNSCTSDKHFLRNWERFLRFFFSSLTRFLLHETKIMCTWFLYDADGMTFMVRTGYKLMQISAGYRDRHLLRLRSFHVSPPCPCVVLQDCADSSFLWQQHDVVCSATAGELFSSSSLSILPAYWQPREGNQKQHFKQL